MSSGLKVTWWGRTDLGTIRSRNQDAFRVLSLNTDGAEILEQDGEADLSTGDLVFVVSDGMGGANAGELASKIVVEKVTELMPRSFRLGAAGIHRGGLDFLALMTRFVHSEILRHSNANEEINGMGATLSMVWLTPERVFFVHVGDSRIYHLPVYKRIVQMTEDHTHVEWLIRQGKLTPAQARTHPQRHQLQQCLGGDDRKIAPQLGSVRYLPGDYLVLCSDGISDDVPPTAIDRFVREPPPRLEVLNPAERHIKEARSVAGRDNLTSLVVKIG